MINFKIIFAVLIYVEKSNRFEDEEGINKVGLNASKRCTIYYRLLQIARLRISKYHLIKISYWEI